MLFAALNMVAALVVLAEAANKLERTDPVAPGLTAKARLVVWMKGVAWMLLAMGAGGALVWPLLNAPPPGPIAQLVLGGFALLVVRTRLKEPAPDGNKPQSDDFTGTTVVSAADIQQTMRRLQPTVQAGRDLAEDIKERT